MSRIWINVGRAALALLPILGSLALKWWSNKENSIVNKGLVILGMEGAGKTMIYDLLRKKKNAGIQTTIEDYKEFKYFFDNKESIVIRKGKDIGGGEEFIAKYYGNMMKDVDIDFCFFVFNSFYYLNDKEYMLNVNARLDFIHRMNILNKKTAIIGSFVDKFPKGSIDGVYKKVSELVKNKSYSQLLSREYFHLLNLTNDSELKIFLKSTLTK